MALLFMVFLADLGAVFADLPKSLAFRRAREGAPQPDVSETWSLAERLSHCPVLSVARVERVGRAA